MLSCYIYSEERSKKPMEKRTERTEPTAAVNRASLASLAEEGERIYTSQLRSKLEPEHAGEFVAIHPESGAYFLGATGTEALSKAHSTMPAALFYLKKVGSETAHKMGGHASRIR
jgi:hypothetical protein